MNPHLRVAQTQLVKLLQADQVTAGMYVRVQGDHLIAGRNARLGADTAAENDDRVRFTRLGTNHYGVSVKRHTGRWQTTPFYGTLEETVEVVCSVMQHLVAAT
jgi:ribosomal protein L27